MSSDLNRRQWLLAAGAAWLGTGSINQLLAAAQGGDQEGPLLHQELGVPALGDRAERRRSGLAERILTDLGKEHGFEVVASKDGRMFEPDKIGQWDAFVFETTGDLTTPGQDRNPPISPEGEKAFYDAIRGGKGFMGMHCATDTFGHHGQRNKGADDPYIQMIGGEFIIHGAQQPVAHRDRRPGFPGSRQGLRRIGQLIHDHRRMVRPQELRRRPARDPGPGHRRDEGPDVSNGPISRSPGRGRTARGASSTRRWAIAKTCGKTRCTRRSCSVRWAGRLAASRPTSSPTSARSRRSTTNCRNERQQTASRRRLSRPPVRRLPLPAVDVVGDHAVDVELDGSKLDSSDRGQRRTTDQRDLTAGRRRRHAITFRGGNAAIASRPAPCLCAR